MDAKRKKDLAQVKKQLAILKKKGLYTPKAPRAKPTRYAKSLLKKYSDVVAGKSFVVKADKAALSKLADTYRTAHGRVIIPAQGTNVRPTITKSGEVVRKMSIAGRKYKFRPVAMGPDGMIEPIGPNQSYSVPIREGNRLRFQSISSREELYKLAQEYAPSGGRGFDILKYVQIIETEGSGKYRITFIADKKRWRIVRADNESGAIAVFRQKFPEYRESEIISVVRID